jgi:chromosome segregation protein
LTSLALLFAILSVNPSPFCLLDEVDAALDESNTIRFVKILQQLEAKNQFVIITHNQETMKAAALLYGVTMNENHISKLISVKLEKAQKITS